MTNREMIKELFVVFHYYAENYLTVEQKELTYAELATLEPDLWMMFEKHLDDECPFGIQMFYSKFWNMKNHIPTLEGQKLMEQASSEFSKKFAHLKNEHTRLLATYKNCHA